MGEPSGARMLDFDEEVARVQVRVVGQFAHGLHRRKADAALLAGPKQLGHGLFLEPFVQIHLQDVLILGPLDAVLENLPAAPLRIAHQVEQARPLIFFGHDQKDEAVPTFVDAPRIQQPLAQPRSHAVAVGVVHEALFQERGYVGLHGQVDVLSAAGVQRAIIGAERGGRGGQPALVGGLLAERLERRRFGKVRRAGRQPRPAARVGHGQVAGVVARIQPGESERRDRAHHQPRVDLAEPGVVQSQIGHTRGRIVVDQDVGPPDHARQPLRLASGIDGHAAFVRIERKEQPAAFRVGRAARKRAALPRRVAVRFFDLDDVGAQVRHELGRVRRGRQMSEFEHLHSVETLHDCTPLSTRLRILWPGAAAQPANSGMTSFTNNSCDSSETGMTMW